MDSYENTLKSLASRVRELRLLANLRQDEVASRAGVGVMTVHRFEHTGRASIENVLRIATALGAEAGFGQLFTLPKYASLDEALERPEALRRKRVRRPR